MCNCASGNIEIPTLASQMRPGTTGVLAFKLLAGDDLNAESGQSLVIVHRGGQIPDESDAEIGQYLRADTDSAPLPIAVSLRGFFLWQRSNRNSRRAIPQVDQHASVRLLEAL